MARRHSEEFRREAVRIALTSGLSRRQVASDLGIGFFSQKAAQVFSAIILTGLFLAPGNIFKRQ
jgi:hypothetical protein